MFEFFVNILWTLWAYFLLAGLRFKPMGGLLVTNNLVTNILVINNLVTNILVTKNFGNLTIW